MSNKPSFFIVGAPKSGTTALCKYLNRHPQIFIPQKKELRYFCYNPPRMSLNEYLKFFEEGNGKICGEGTPKYLRCEFTPQAIYDFNPDSKIIIMLREPVDLLYSFHAQLLWNGTSEDESDFFKAMALEHERRKGRMIPKKCKDPESLYYRNVVKFTEQITRYWEYFGKEQVHIILFDDFISNLSQVYQDTLDFLGVDSNFVTDFNVINSRKKTRNSFLQSLYKRPPQKILEIGKFLVPLPQNQRRFLLEKTKNLLKRINKTKVSKKGKSLPPDVHKVIQQEFVPEIQKLSQLIERDLSNWIR